ncbi:MAG: YdeI/OmpD-associated family protein [Flavihumibacter sp.]
MRFKKEEQIKTMIRASANGGAPAPVEGVDHKARTVKAPEDLEKLLQLKKNKKAADFFNKLSFTNKKEYVVWITTAKREDTRQHRLQQTVEKLTAGKKNPSEK